jgi:hypothetical protein
MCDLSRAAITRSLLTLWGLNRGHGASGSIHLNADACPPSPVTGPVMAERRFQVRPRVPRRLPRLQAAGMTAPDGDVTAASCLRGRAVALVPGGGDQARSPRVPHPALIGDDWQTYLFHASIQTRCRAWRKVPPPSGDRPGPFKPGQRRSLVQLSCPASAASARASWPALIWRCRSAWASCSAIRARYWAM